MGERAASGIPVPAEAIAMIDDSERHFSAVRVWEVAIKFALGKQQFGVEPDLFRRTLLDQGYTELAVTGEHGGGAGELPLLPKDPFDRLLVAQAMVEGITLLTVDAPLARSGGVVRRGLSIHLRKCIVEED